MDNAFLGFRKTVDVTKEESDQWVKDFEKFVTTQTIWELANNYVMAIHTDPFSPDDPDGLLFEDPDYNEKLLAVICKDKKVGLKLIETLLLDVAERDPTRKIVSEGHYWGVVRPLKKFLGQPV